MPIIKQSEHTFTPVPAGPHPARCYCMVSLGTQPSSNPKFGPKFKVVLQFEFPNEQIKVNDVSKPMMTSHFLSAYLGSATKPTKTAQFLTAWRGRPFTAEELAGFDLSNVIGAPCLLNIVHEERGGQIRESVAGISPLPKGITVPPQINPSLHYEIEEGRNAKFQSLAPWMQKMIEQCQEWTKPAVAEHEPEPATEENADDVPF